MSCRYRLALAAVLPILCIILASFSPLLAWRDPIYIAAGFAGIAGLCLMLAQPLLSKARILALTPQQARRAHRSAGLLLLACVVTHVIGLWITSPPDVIDALLFRSPTSFSVWGVIAMWAAFIVAGMALWRTPRKYWRLLHRILATAMILASVLHSLQIIGAMEFYSKILLCCATVAATAWMWLEKR